MSAKGSAQERANDFCYSFFAISRAQVILGCARTANRTKGKLRKREGRRRNEKRQEMWINQSSTLSHSFVDK
jgi:hypothetical protein